MHSLDALCRKTLQSNSSPAPAPCDWSMIAPIAPPNALSVSNLDIWRGERCLCHGISFEVTSGEALHLLGANGAGKTTLIRVLTGLGRADGGKLRWRGQSLRESGAEYRASLAYLGHSSGVKLGLTPRENLMAAGALLAVPGATDAAAALARVGLAQQTDLPCSMLSMGQRRRAALARLLLVRVPVWFLDEPLTSLDRSGVGLLAGMLKEHLAVGGLAVFASHQPLGLEPFPVKTLLLGEAV